MDQVYVFIDNKLYIQFFNIKFNGTSTKIYKQTPRIYRSLSIYEVSLYDINNKKFSFFTIDRLIDIEYNISTQCLESENTLILRIPTTKVRPFLVKQNSLFGGIFNYMDYDLKSNDNEALKNAEFEILSGGGKGPGNSHAKKILRGHKSKKTKQSSPSKTKTTINKAIRVLSSKPKMKH